MKSNKVNITFVLPNLLPGGAERVLSYIAQNIDPKKFKATLLIIGFSNDASYDVKNIGLVFLQKSRVLNGIPALYNYIRKNKPDILVSAIGHLNTVMGLIAPFFPKTKFIIREVSVVSTMSQVSQTNESLSISDNLRSIMAHLGYRSVDKIICQSQDMADDFLKIYKIPVKKMAIINNPITDSVPLKKIEKSPDDIVKFITVGRLSQEKGHIRIIEMLSKLTFQFHYTIIGKGPLKENIFNVIDAYNLNEKITYIPYSNDVSSYMAQNDLFLQGSYVEGFPNTVLESCYVGTPVIAFNVPGGTKEIINHEVNGYLVENEEDYLHYLRNRLDLQPKDVRASVELKFNKEKIISQYEALFN